MKLARLIAMGYKFFYETIVVRGCGVSIDISCA